MNTDMHNCTYILRVCVYIHKVGSESDSIGLKTVIVFPLKNFYEEVKMNKNPYLSTSYFTQKIQALVKTFDKSLAENNYCIIFMHEKVHILCRNWCPKSALTKVGTVIAIFQFFAYFLYFLFKYFRNNLIFQS